MTIQATIDFALKSRFMRPVEVFNCPGCNDDDLRAEDMDVTAIFEQSVLDDVEAALGCGPLCIGCVDRFFKE